MSTKGVQRNQFWGILASGLYGSQSFNIRLQQDYKKMEF